MEIGKVMKILREKHKLSMSAIAEKLDMKKGTYAAYEYGQCEPNLTVVRKLAKFYKVSADYLLDINQEESNYQSPLEQLQSQYNMTPLEKRIMENYIKLNEQDRKKAMNWVKNAVNEEKADK